MAASGGQGAGGTPGQGGQQGTGGETQGGDGMRTHQIQARGLTFDAREIGSTGEPVLLLHGFPETSLMWTGLMPELSGNGYHCLAPDQRGYSPGARPNRSLRTENWS